MYLNLFKILLKPLRFVTYSILRREFFHILLQAKHFNFSLLFVCLSIFSLSACSEQNESENQADKTTTENVNQKTPRFNLSVIGSSAHSNTHFTQGLFFLDNVLYESIGHYGQSALIKYDNDTQGISVQRKLDDAYFAEGATPHGNAIYQLTWRAGKAFIYQGAMLNVSEGFHYEGEGWGLTSDGENLWLSDGTDQIDILEIGSNNEISSIESLSISYKDQPLDRLNELEWVNGWLLANRWYDNRIFVINPETGIVEIAFNLDQLAIPELQVNRNHVLNGIAWNPNTNILWITGKNWTKFYQLMFDHPIRQ